MHINSENDLLGFYFFYLPSQHTSPQPHLARHLSKVQCHQTHLKICMETANIRCTFEHYFYANEFQSLDTPFFQWTIPGHQHSRRYI